MKASLPELEAAATIARLGGFRPAARALNVSSSALSHAVAALESRLGVRLFNRTTRSVALTAAGEAFVADIAPALAAIDGAVERVRESQAQPTGMLRLNTSLGAARLLLEPLLLEYLRRYPGMSLELVTEGALVGQSDANPMARVQQIDQVYVDVRQPASMLEAIRKSAGQSASSDGGKDGNVKILDAQGNPYPVSGHILFSGINVDAGTGDVVIRIRVNNPERHLLPGMFVRARVPQGGDIQGLLVPQQAVSRSSTGQARVWVVGQDGKAGVKNVELGKLVERQYLVRSGLAAGERVIVEGQDRLQPGMPVSAQPWALAADGKTVAP